MKTFYYITLLYWAMSCTKQEVAPCYNKDPIKELAWMPDIIQHFKSGFKNSTWVTLYYYQNQYFFAFENAAVSGPSGYIYNCSGVNLDKLVINYNEFYNKAKKVKIIMKISK